MEITEGNIATAVDYIIMAVLLMVSVGNAITSSLPTVV